MGQRSVDLAPGSRLDGAADHIGAPGLHLTVAEMIYPLIEGQQLLLVDGLTPNEINNPWDSWQPHHCHFRRILD